MPNTSQHICFHKCNQKKMSGQLSHELEVNVPTSEAWELYGRLGLAKLLVEDGSIVEKIEVIEGDGGIGTILKKTYTPGMIIDKAIQTDKHRINLEPNQ